MALLALLGCERSRAPEKVAVAFMETLLFSRDPTAARYAQPTLQPEIRRFLDATGSGPLREPLARHLLQAEPVAGGIRYRFRVEFRPKGGRPVASQFFVTVRQEGTDWRVSDFGWESETP